MPPHLVDYANTLGPASRGAPSQRNRGRCQHGFGPPYIISQSKTKEMDLTRPSLNLFSFLFCYFNRPPPYLPSDSFINGSQIRNELIIITHTRIPTHLLKISSVFKRSGSMAIAVNGECSLVCLSTGMRWVALLGLSRSNICYPKSFLGTQIVYTAFSSNSSNRTLRFSFLKGDVPSGPPLPLPRIFGG